MYRRTRLASTVLAVALAVTVLPAAASAQSGTPLRPAVRDQPDPRPGVVLRGSGWGHSVGMSQYGAYAMARKGHSHSAILQHYYRGVKERTWAEESPQRVTVELAKGGVTSTPAEAIAGPITWVYTPPGGGDTTTVTQPAGTTWTVRGAGSATPARVELRRTDGSSAVAGNGTLQARLNDRDVVQAASERLRTYHPTGTQQYAYGWVQYKAADGKLAVTNLLPLEAYLRGLGEVPSSWGANGGQAALRAQAIIARGYVLGRNRVTCATAACQVFYGYMKELEQTGGLWTKAVTDTTGRYLVGPDGKVATTYYSSSHGGRTEASQDSWAYGGAVSYLTSVPDPYSLEAPNPMRSWTAVASNAEFRRVAGAGLSRIERVEILSRTAGGSPRTLRVTGPEGAREFSTTPTGARTDRACNRVGYAGNSLRCDLATTVRDAAGTPFAGAGGRPPSSQIRAIGFAPFTDDDGNTHEYAIVWANAAGIAKGVEATRFAPRDRVTRAQMASFIYRTFDVPKRTSHGFRDVDGGPHEEAIASVAAAGIAKGFDAQRFGPTEPVTREQMASFIARAMGLKAVRPTFDDVPPSGTHAGNVGAIAAEGITAGCRDNLYCPGNPVLRDQMASFLHRAVRTLR